MNAKMSDADVNYVEGLKLWREYMLLANEGDWDPQVENDIRPDAGETESDWLERCWPLFEPLPEFPIVHLESREEMWADWDGGFKELHLRVNVSHFSKAELREAFEKLLDEHTEAKRGRPDRIRQRAFYQPNAELNLKVLTDTLAVMKSSKPTLVEVGLEVFGDWDRDSLKTRVWDAQQRGKSIIAAVRRGCFPQPDRAANGQI